MRRVLLVLAFAAFFAPDNAWAGLSNPELACRRAIVATRGDLIKTAVRLERASKSQDKERCLAFRQYAEVVSKARDVFTRCNVDRGLDADVSSMNAAMSDVQSAMAKSCADR